MEHNPQQQFTACRLTVAVLLADADHIGISRLGAMLNLHDSSIKPTAYRSRAIFNFADLQRV
jgi:hypothetical protein